MRRIGLQIILPTADEAMDTWTPEELRSFIHCLGMSDREINETFKRLEARLDEKDIEH